MNKCLGGGGDVFSFLPYQADLDRDFRSDGDPFYFGYIGEHGGEEETAAFSLAEEFQGGGDLAGVQDYLWPYSQGMELHIQQVILNRVVIK